MAIDFSDEEANPSEDIDEGQELEGTGDDHDQDGPADDEPFAAATEEAPKLTGKARARERAASHAAMKEQNAEMRRQLAEMSRAVTESANASRMAAEAATRASQPRQRPWEEVADERVQAAAAAIREDDPKTVQAYHRTVREVAQEGARLELQAAQRQAAANAPQPLNPIQQELQSYAPWITNPAHNAGVRTKLDQLFAASGIDPRTVSDATFMAKAREAIAHYAQFAGLKANLPRQEGANAGAVAGAGARSFAGGQNATVDTSQMTQFMRDFADSMYPELPPAKRYATYMKQVVAPEVNRQKTR